MKGNKISIFKTKSDLYLNFENNNEKIMLITGLSGSGKSTLTQNILNKENGYKVSLDLSFFHGYLEVITEEEQHLIEKFKREYPEWSQEIFEKSILKEKMYIKYSNLFYDFAIDNFKKINEPLIIEGGQIFKYIDINKIKDKKIIIKRTSLITCSIRRLKRTIKQLNKKIKLNQINKKQYIKSIFIDIKHIITHHPKWYKKLNLFIEKVTKR